ncbi:MAG TPA: D-alanyl-D-alanine carboxypeptidase [Pyrinomonadaceae bacterium]|nr:D-alanyl-D-alanine carboxypeptidase [Pyrinomonadaceae bacterium]
MNSFVTNKGLWLGVVFALLTGSTSVVFGQAVRPLMQPIVVSPSAAKPVPTPYAAAKPLVTKTGSSMAIAGRKTSMPVLADMEIPGHSGVLVEDLNGNTVLDSNSNFAFNPASNVKVATAYAVLKTFGPNYRFQTSVWTDGQIDPTTGILNGNLYVSGRDPVFNYEHAVALSNELNRLGVRQINGDLIVTSNFVMNYSSSTERAGASLAATMDAAKRSAVANRAWQSYLINSRNTSSIGGFPGVSFTGGSYVQTLPTNAKLLFSHESAPLREIVKLTMCYSNNYLSEKLGDMLGGAYAVARVVQMNAQIPPEQFVLQTSSGLGINRVTPRAMMSLLRTLQKELARNKMTFADIMPVAGIDKGTLERRFDTDFSRGSVVGKTGTLGATDGGASSLCGEMQTRTGKVLFVIFNQRGNNNRFRGFQNSLVSIIQGQLGGAAPIAYVGIPLDQRIAGTRITYPDTRLKMNE